MVQVAKYAPTGIESYRVPVEVPPARRVDLVAHLSGAFDLAEGQPLGHSARIAHLAMAFARRLRLDAATRRRVLYTALLHDSGVAVREVPDGVDAAGGHTAAGAWIASLMGLDASVQQAIRSTHERWDGEGRPHRLVMTDIPVEALVVSTAHLVSDLLGNAEHPLRARTVATGLTINDIEPLSGLLVARAAVAELRGDAMWMDMWDEDLASLVARDAPAEGRASNQHVDRIAMSIGEVVDSAVREPHRAEHVAALASELGRQFGLNTAYCRALRVAALVLDVGLLGVPRNITEKPAILSVEEMEYMHRHPGWSAQLIEGIPGFEEIARWVEGHHERTDSRGYPEQLQAEDIPLASRILAVADSFWALCADRPYRKAVPAADAVAMIEGAAGAQYDADVVVYLRRALTALRARTRVEDAA